MCLETSAFKCSFPVFHRKAKDGQTVQKTNKGFAFLDDLSRAAMQQVSDQRSSWSVAQYDKTGEIPRTSYARLANAHHIFDGNEPELHTYISLPKGGNMQLVLFVCLIVSSLAPHYFVMVDTNKFEWF